MAAILYYIHDPMCSWCWGFRPTWDALKLALPESVNVINVAGGLARDCEDPMSESMQAAIQGYWRKIQQQLGTAFNFDFWQCNQPRRSTWMACRATIAADKQGAQELMIDAIQRGYYLRAMNPSDIPVLLELAEEAGMDKARFEQDLLSPETQLEFERQLALARSLPIEGFPSLVLEIRGKHIRVAQDYLNVEPMLSEITRLLAEP